MRSALVICLGNPLRGDDGFGPAVGARLRDLGVPDERLRIVTGLLPELAADVASADAVLFVDASAGLPPGEVLVSQVSMASAGARWTHTLSPAELLALCSAAYGRVPRATLLAVGGRGWEPGAGLSADVAARVAEVADRAARWRTGAHDDCGVSSLSR